MERKEGSALHTYFLGCSCQESMRTRSGYHSFLFLAQPISMSGRLDPKNMFSVHLVHVIYTATI